MTKTDLWDDATLAAISLEWWPPSVWNRWAPSSESAAALLNSQPMGFSAPTQIVGDAREHDVEVRLLDINASDWDGTLEPEMRRADRHALGLGLRLVSGL